MRTEAQELEHLQQLQTALRANRAKLASLGEHQESVRECHSSPADIAQCRNENNQKAARNNERSDLRVKISEVMKAHPSLDEEISVLTSFLEASRKAEEMMDASGLPADAKPDNAEL